MDNALLLYPLAMCVTFVAVAIRGFQHKNVIGNQIAKIKARLQPTT